MMMYLWYYLLLVGGCFVLFKADIAFGHLWFLIYAIVISTMFAHSMR